MCAQRTLSKKIRTRRKKSQASEIKPSCITDVPDIEILNISPITQIFVGCRIGQDITVVTPWIFIKKEIILDHLDLYEENSEFYRIQRQIKKHPGTKIMIGSCSYNIDIPVEFYVCTTVKSQQRVENYMKDKNELMMKKVMDSLYRTIGRWHSLGSEKQIKSEMNLNNRVLLAVDIETDFPIRKGRTRFRIKLAEEFPDGYVELTARRPTNMRFSWRKRVDRAAQVTPTKHNKSTQTLVSTVFQQTTQHPCEDPLEMPISVKLAKEMKHFLDVNSKHICDLLNVNFHLNLYENDYSSLKTDTNSVSTQNPIVIKLYQDVINCRRTRVSCVSWNAIISGVVAAAYSKTPLLSFSKRIHEKEVQDAAATDHLILIWYYKDNVRPKLYLHAKAEVTALSFCPYDANILVAGYSNGLIAIYDLTDLLIDQETPTFLTESEQQYHLTMANLTPWFLRPLGSNHIFPALTCGFKIGHTSPVTSIVWLPSNYYISQEKSYKRCEDGEEHMQFLTISMNENKVLVWDLKSNVRKAASKTKKCRLATTPEALTKNISPLQELKQHFVPVFKFHVPKEYNKNLLMKMVMKNELYHYIAKNPHTLDDLDATTYFEVDKLAFGFDMTRKITFTTGYGVIQTAFWEDATYIDERPEGVFKIQTFAVVHDGPILVCEVNSFFPGIILTVGGSVFAVWDCDRTRDALFWRKSLYRYQSGMWCSRPLSILVIRTDRCYEIWNVCERSETPVHLHKYKGYDLMKFYGDSTKVHSRKNTFITTDALGALKVNLLPSEMVSRSDEDLRKATEYLERVHELKQYTKLIKARCKKVSDAQEAEINDAASAPNLLNVDEPDVPIQKKPSNISKKVRFDENLKGMMQRKRINRTKLNEDRLKCLEEEASKKFHATFIPVDQEKVLTAVQEKIKDNITLTQNVKRRVSLTFTKEKTTVLKQRFMESFQEIEREVIRVVQNKNYDLNEKYDQYEEFRKKFEAIAHNEMIYLERTVTVTTEVDVVKRNL